MGAPPSDSAGTPIDEMASETGSAMSVGLGAGACSSLVVVWGTCSAGSLVLQAAEGPLVASDRGRVADGGIELGKLSWALVAAGLPGCVGIVLMLDSHGSEAGTMGGSLSAAAGSSRMMSQLAAGLMPSPGYGRMSLVSWPSVALSRGQVVESGTERVRMPSGPALHSTVIVKSCWMPLIMLLLLSSVTLMTGPGEMGKNCRGSKPGCCIATG